MATQEQKDEAVRELLGHLVFSHTFHSFEVKERCEELLSRLVPEKEEDPVPEPVKPSERSE